ncbi:MAG: hypothetical protein K6F81_05200 [Acholeplasmatales bacterium]|nr:hypothetical protein [Acholeplasmatales bacterium]
MEKTISKPMKDPLVHIVKKDTITTGKLIGIKAIAFLLAFIVSSILLGIAEGCDPFTFLISLINGSFGTGLSIWMLLRDMAILLGLGLALLPAFKMKYWNVGADGQALIAALAAYMILYFGHDSMGDTALVILSLLVAVAAGIIWAVIPAIFKAFWNTNETLFTLMMNYIAIQAVAIFINSFATGGSNTLPNIYEGSLGMIYEYLTPVLIVALLTAGIAIYIKYTKHGYELSLVGDSFNTAKYAGVNVKKVIIRTLVLSGAICGIIGFILTNGLNHVVNTNTLNGRGFTAIIIVWLANFNPWFMILTTFMIVFLQRGSAELLMELGITNVSITSIITSIFIFFIIGCTFFSRYNLIFRRNSEGKIDNKFLAFCEKIAIPVVKFFTVVYVNITNFLKKIYNKISKKKKFEIIDLKKNNEEHALDIKESKDDSSSLNDVASNENETNSENNEATNEEKDNKEDE